MFGWFDANPGETTLGIELGWGKLAMFVELMPAGKTGTPEGPAKFGALNPDCATVGAWPGCG
jgi:hypothetical protein